MATIPLTVNGTVFPVPLPGDTAGVAGATAISGLLAALLTGVAQVDGSINLVQLRSAASVIAASGVVRLGALDTLAWRTADDTQDVTLGLDAGGGLASGSWSSVMSMAAFSVVNAASANFLRAPLVVQFDPQSLVNTARASIVVPETGYYLAWVDGTFTLNSGGPTGGFQATVGAGGSDVVTWFSNQSFSNGNVQPFAFGELRLFESGEPIGFNYNNVTGNVTWFGRLTVKRMA